MGSQLYHFPVCAAVGRIDNVNLCPMLTIMDLHYELNGLSFVGTTGKPPAIPENMTG
jgi:hypothetical protein